jgi:flavin reductase (DIM6/NTAB) family NADH-FMN oxidoreductase RutF
VISEPVRTPFDDLMRRLDHPMVVVTTASDGRQAGCLVGFHSQCSIDPPEYVVWISKANHTYEVGARADTFAVHVLGRDDRDLAVLFGTTTGDEVDKFERCSWVPGPDGVPVLDGVESRFLGRRTALLDPGSDHVAVVLAPLEASAGDGDLLWFGEVADLPAAH